MVKFIGAEQEFEPRIVRPQSSRHPSLSDEDKLPPYPILEPQVYEISEAALCKGGRLAANEGSFGVNASSPLRRNCKPFDVAALADTDKGRVTSSQLFEVIRIADGFQQLWESAAPSQLGQHSVTCARFSASLRGVCFVLGAPSPALCIVGSFHLWAEGSWVFLFDR